MLSFLNRLNLIRYLIVWRVNSSLVFFPRYFSLDLSMVVGTIISRRLPTKETGSWRKVLDPLIEFEEQAFKKRRNPKITVPEVSWPIDSVLLGYPIKRTYGRDELIFWELKLFGEHADHGLFLEVILPALEEASYTSEPEWFRRNRLWGHFDIQDIYVARGKKWEPVVKDGRLDLRYRANPNQWMENLKFNRGSSYNYKNIAWITPFDFSGIIIEPDEFNLTDDIDTLKYKDTPTFSLILMGLVYRLNQLIPGRSRKLRKASTILKTEEQTAFQETLDLVENISINKKNIKSAPPTWPGKWIGTQRFSTIPAEIVPYLEAASILHIGKQTHFGCGTFVVT